MTLDQIRYFYTAATLCHIGQAAQQEKISQPSLSIAIKKLEKELGVPLLQANGRGIELTESGHEFLGYARSILEQAEAARAHMTSRADRLNQEIHLAYTSAVACGYIPRLFKQFLAHNQTGALIYSDEMPSDEIRDGLLNGRFDLGICSRISLPPELVQIPVLSQPLVLITPKSHPFCRTIPESPDLLCNESFVSYRQDYPMYRQVSEFLARNGVQPHISHFAYSEDAIARLVEQELGISIVAETGALSMYDIAVLRPSWLTQERSICLTYAPGRYRGRAARSMLAFITEHAQKNSLE